MKDYYSILDIPTTATLEEIRSQYKQLVRIYHPDRFANSTDKIYAEQKLREIIEAYNALTATQPHTGWHSGAPDNNHHSSIIPPKPTLSHTSLDFGVLEAGTKKVKTLQVGNAGGKARNLSFSYSDEKEWFTVSRGQRIYADQALPLLIDVTADSRSLKPGQYDGWLQVNMDGVWTRVMVHTKVVEPIRRVGFSPRLALAFVLCIVIVVGVFMSPLSVGVSVNQNLWDSLRHIWASPVSVRALGPSTNRLVFSVKENAQDILYIANPDGTEQHSLNISGFSPSWSPDGSQIAYIAEDKGLPQVYIVHYSNMEPIQLTATSATKSSPAWSPDGHAIVYISHESAQSWLEMIDLPTMETRQLTMVAAGVVHDFTWSPSGEQILVTLERDDQLRVHRVALNADETPSILTSFDSWTPAWSPNGLSIAVGSPDGIFVLTQYGENPQQLTTGLAFQPSWSADGQKMAYLTGLPSSGRMATQTHLWVMESTGQNREKVSDMNCITYTWSPTGEELLCITGNANSSSPTLYLWMFDIVDKNAFLVAEISTSVVSLTK